MEQCSCWRRWVSNQRGVWIVNFKIQPRCFDLIGQWVNWGAIISTTQPHNSPSPHSSHCPNIKACLLIVVTLYRHFVVVSIYLCMILVSKDLNMYALIHWFLINGMQGINPPFMLKKSMLDPIIFVPILQYCWYFANISEKVHLIAISHTINHQPPIRSIIVRIHLFTENCNQLIKQSPSGEEWRRYRHLKHSETSPSPSSSASSCPRPTTAAAILAPPPSWTWSITQPHDFTAIKGKNSILSINVDSFCIEISFLERILAEDWEGMGCEIP